MDKPKFALYYPGASAPLSWIKNALLFYDGVALFTSGNIKSPIEHFQRRRDDNAEYIWHDLVLNDVVMVVPSETVITDSVSEEILSRLDSALESGKLDKLQKKIEKEVEQDGYRDEIFMSFNKTGMPKDRDIDSFFKEEVAHRMLYMSGHIRRKPHLVGKVAVSRDLFVLFSIFHSEIVMSMSSKIGVDMIASTDNKTYQEAFKTFCRTAAPLAPSVEDEIRIAGKDLTEIPVSEIIDFKKELRPIFQQYSNELARDSLIATELSEEGRRNLYSQRHQRLIHEFEHAQESAIRDWGRFALIRVPLSLSVAIFGVAISNHLGLGLAGEIAASVTGSLSPSLLPSSSPETTSSYLFNARSRFANMYH